jgi:hypothetical protein
MNMAQGRYPRGIFIVVLVSKMMVLRLETSNITLSEGFG